MVDVRFPDEPWADVEEGTEALLDEWLVAVGDRVEQGQIIANVVLVKATHELAARHCTLANPRNHQIQLVSHCSISLRFF